MGFTHSVRFRRPLAVVAAIATVAGCSTPPAALSPAESRLGGAASRGTISINGKTLTVRTQDGKPLANLQVQVGGQLFSLKDGKLDLPASALSTLTADGRDSMRIFVPGYVPAVIKPGQSADEIVLIPQRPAILATNVTPAGAVLQNTDGTLSLNIPAGMTTQAQTQVAVGVYTPQVSATENAEAARERAVFLAKVAARTQKPVPAASDCDSLTQPLPCPPLKGSMGVIAVINGPIKPGTLTVTRDLGSSLRGWNGQGKPPWETTPSAWTADALADAKVAAQILSAFQKIDASPDGAAIRAELQASYGISLNGTQLTFAVQVGVDQALDGHVRTDVVGLALLGVALEFTAVSSTSGSLPPAALAPDLFPPTGSTPSAMTAETAASLAATYTDTSDVGSSPLAVNGAGLLSPAGGSLIGLDGASLIGLDGGTLIGLDGATLIGLDGGSLIGLDGGSLIGLDGASLIGLDGGTLIGNDAGSLIGNDAGSLISNTGGALAVNIRVPEKLVAPAPKYRLKALTEPSYDESIPTHPTRMRALSFNGTPISDWVPVDGAGNAYLAELPNTQMFFIVEVESGPWVLQGLVIAPGKKVTTVQVTAASTVATLVLNDALRKKKLDLTQIYLHGYNEEVERARHNLSTSQARNTCSPPSGFMAFLTSLPVVGWLVRLILWILKVLGIANSIDLDVSKFIVPGATPPAPVPVAPADVKVTYFAGHFAVGRNMGVDGDASNDNFFYVTANSQVLKVHRESGKTAVVFDPTAAPLNSTAQPPMFTAVDSDVTGVYAADANNGIIWYRDPAGTVSKYMDLRASAAPAGEVYGLARDPDPAHRTLYASDSGANVLWRMVDGVETPELVAGALSQGGDADGAGLAEARFRNPAGIAFDDQGALLLADEMNNKIRRITFNGALTEVSTYAGTGVAGRVDGAVPADKASTSEATLNMPRGVLWNAGRLVIADTGNNLVRVIETTQMKTVAGDGTANVSAGTSGLTAQFNHPSGLGMVKKGFVVGNSQPVSASVARIEKN